MSEHSIRPALPDGAPDFDPLSAYFERNPYEELKRMREAGRAWRHRGSHNVRDSGWRTETAHRPALLLR